MVKKTYKTEVVRSRLTKKQKEVLVKKAEKIGLNISNYLLFKAGVEKFPVKTKKEVIDAKTK